MPRRISTRQHWTEAQFDPSATLNPSIGRRAVTATLTATSTPVPTEKNILLEDFESDETKVKNILGGKVTIVWLVVIGIIILATVMIVGYVICRCRSRRKNHNKRYNSRRYQVTDDRYAINTFKDRGQVIHMEDRTGKSSVKGKHKKGQAKFMEPVIVDEMKMVPPPAAYRKDLVSRWHTGLGKGRNKLGQIVTGT